MLAPQLHLLASALSTAIAGAAVIQQMAAGCYDARWARLSLVLTRINLKCVRNVRQDKCKRAVRLVQPAKPEAGAIG